MHYRWRNILRITRDTNSSALKWLVHLPPCVDAAGSYLTRFPVWFESCDELATGYKPESATPAQHHAASNRKAADSYHCYRHESGRIYCTKETRFLDSLSTTKW